MNLDRYALKAAPLLQHRGNIQAEISRRAREFGHIEHAVLMQEAAATDYRSARQLMEIEAPAE